VAAYRAVDEHASWLEEAALGEFIASGAFARHVHRARKVYAGRRQALAQARLRYLPEIRLVGAENGLHQAWLLPEGSAVVDRFLEVADGRGLIAARPSLSAAAQGVPLERVVLVDVARIDEARIGGTLGAVAEAMRAVCRMTRPREIAAW
jgi:DNA-binding transcriptional MocR family regulator